MKKESENGLGISKFEKRNTKEKGKIKRKKGGVEGIIEEKDCKIKEKKIKEKNTGIMCIEIIKLNNCL